MEKEFIYPSKTRHGHVWVAGVSLVMHIVFAVKYIYIYINIIDLTEVSGTVIDQRNLYRAMGGGVRGVTRESVQRFKPLGQHHPRASLLLPASGVVFTPNG